MTFSIIIPVHNAGEMLRRCLESLTLQGIPKEAYEVILVNDASTDGCMSIAEDFCDKLQIVCVATNTDCHCPGNTRNEGLKHVRGEWLCFCDQDDFYEPNALLLISRFIRATNERHAIVTIMRSWNEEKGYQKDYVHRPAWLHGKFYNMENLIRKYGITFKPNLKTHEDIYFNGCVIDKLFRMGRDFTFLDVPTYVWVDNENSLTRRETNDRGYFHENFADYIDSAALPFWESAKETKDVLFINMIIMTLLHAYFYDQGITYYLGEQEDHTRLIRGLVRKIMTDFEMDAMDIVRFVYADPFKYNEVREECQQIENGAFVEEVSFKDYVINMAS